MNDRAELLDAIERSPLLPDAALRRHWQRLLPMLPDSLALEVAAVLRTVEGERLDEPPPETERELIHDQRTSASFDDGLMFRDRWLAAAGPWWRWGLYLPLIAPGVASFGASMRGNPMQEAEPLMLLLSERLRASPSLVVLDIEPLIGLRVAASLAQARLAHPVPFLPRWPYLDAVLPMELLLGSLEMLAMELPDQLTAASVVMALDNGRNMSVPCRPWSDPRADNRGEIAGDDLPSAAALQAAGIAKVIDVRLAGEPVPVPFKRFAYGPFERAGITVEYLTL